MANTIRIKNSGVSSNTPSAGSLEYGELALNYADGRLFFKKDASNVKYFTTSEYSNSVISANTASIVDTVPLSSFSSIEYTITLKQGSSSSMKMRTSKFLVHYNSGLSTIDSTEYGIIETGSSPMSNPSVSASINGASMEIRVTVTDAALTNVNCIVLKTSVI